MTEVSDITAHTPILFGQMIIGPAGSGKTTYCQMTAEILQNMNRELIIVNLDPDNENLPYQANISISEMARLQEIMENEGLGPNGSFLYCISLLEENFWWLRDRIREEFFKVQEKIEQESTTSGRKRPYILFDCPGQIELYTNFPKFKEIVRRLLNFQDEFPEEPKLELRLTTVNLVDSHYAADPGRYIGVVLNSLLSMLHIESPFVNILSKVDLIERDGQTDFGLNFYCELPDLERLVDRVSDDPFLAKYKKLTAALGDVIDSFGLVSYEPISKEKPESLIKALNLIDKANGFSISDMTNTEEAMNFYRTIQADFEASKYGAFEQ